MFLRPTYVLSHMCPTVSTMFHFVSPMCPILAPMFQNTSPMFQKTSPMFQKLALMFLSQMCLYCNQCAFRGTNVPFSCSKCAALASSLSLSLSPNILPSVAIHGREYAVVSVTRPRVLSVHLSLCLSVTSRSGILSQRLNVLKAVVILIF